MGVADDGGGGSNMQVQLAIAGLVVLVTMFAGMFAFLMKSSSDEGAKEKPDKKNAKKEGSAGQKRRGALDRMQRGAAGSSVQAAAEAAAQEDDDEDDGDEQEEGGRGKKNTKKQDKKAEKKAQQQAERQMRQQQQESKADKQNKYKQKQAEKDAERERQEEEERKAEEDKARREQEEFEKWKVSFSVEAEGEDTAADLGDSSVESFISFIQMRKVVHLEDVANRFRMRTAAAINRIKELEKLDRLSGIFDDRGKYVYLTTEEMHSLADWMQKKGRISRPDLVAACNRIIRLEPTAEDEARLREEALSAAEGLGEEEAAAEMSS